jgi:hypothetical protein
MPEFEQKWRLRLFLATWAIGASENLSWATALNEDPAHSGESATTLTEISDEAIREAVLTRRRVEAVARFEALREASRRTPQESRVTILTRVGHDPEP